MKTEVYFNSPIRNCLNCAHAVHNNHGDPGEFSTCVRCGTYCSTQRQYPDYKCNADFSGWQPAPPKPPTFWRRFRNWMFSQS